MSAISFWSTSDSYRMVSGYPNPGHIKLVHRIAPSDILGTALDINYCLHTAGFSVSSTVAFVANLYLLQIIPYSIRRNSFRCCVACQARKYSS